MTQSKSCTKQARNSAIIVADLHLDNRSPVLTISHEMHMKVAKVDEGQCFIKILGKTSAARHEGSHFQRGGCREVPLSCRIYHLRFGIYSTNSRHDQPVACACSRTEKFWLGGPTRKANEEAGYDVGHRVINERPFAIDQTLWRFPKWHMRDIHGNFGPSHAVVESLLEVKQRTFP